MNRYESIGFGAWPPSLSAHRGARSDVARSRRARADPCRQVRRARRKRPSGLPGLRGLVRGRRKEVRLVRVLQPQPRGNRRCSHRSSATTSRPGRRTRDSRRASFRACTTASSPRRLPKDQPTTEVTWTLTANGQTLSIPASLDRSVFHLAAARGRRRLSRQHPAGPEVRSDGRLGAGTARHRRQPHGHRGASPHARCLGHRRRSAAAAA